MSQEGVGSSTTWGGSASGARTFSSLEGTVSRSAALPFDI